MRTTTYTGFAIEDADRAGALLELTLAALGGDGPLATEPHALPGSLVAALGGRPLRDVGPELRAARAVKDPDEIEALRAAVGIADAGQAAARAALRAGRPSSSCGRRRARRWSGARARGCRSSPTS